MNQNYTQFQQNQFINTQNSNVNTPINNDIQPNPNNNSTLKSISKHGKNMIIAVLICTLIIYFDNYLTSMHWYWNLRIQAALVKDEALLESLNLIEEYIIYFNWIIALVITIASVIYYCKDKKQGNNTNIYTWYITGGILHIIGLKGLSPIIYSLSTLTFSINNYQLMKENNASTTKDKVILALSVITTIMIVIPFIVSLMREIANN